MNGAYEIDMVINIGWLKGGNRAGEQTENMDMH